MEADFSAEIVTFRLVGGCIPPSPLKSATEDNVQEKSLGWGVHSMQKIFMWNLHDACTTCVQKVNYVISLSLLIFCVRVQYCVCKDLIYATAIMNTVSVCQI